MTAFINGAWQVHKYKNKLGLKFILNLFVQYHGKWEQPYSVCNATLYVLLGSTINILTLVGSDFLYIYLFYKCRYCTHMVSAETSLFNFSQKLPLFRWSDWILRNKHLACIQEVPSSNLDWHTLSWVRFFRGFSQSFHENSPIIP